MSALKPTIVVHGGAGTYATIIHDHIGKKAIEDGILNLNHNFKNYD